MNLNEQIKLQNMVDTGKLDAYEAALLLIIFRYHYPKLGYSIVAKRQAANLISVSYNTIDKRFKSLANKKFIRYEKVRGYFHIYLLYPESSPDEASKDKTASGGEASPNEAASLDETDASPEDIDISSGEAGAPLSDTEASPSDDRKISKDNVKDKEKANLKAGDSIGSSFNLSEEEIRKSFMVASADVSHRPEDAPGPEDFAEQLNNKKLTDDEFCNLALKLRYYLSDEELQNNPGAAHDMIVEFIKIRPSAAQQLVKRSVKHPKIMLTPEQIDALEDMAYIYSQSASAHISPTIEFSQALNKEEEESFTAGFERIFGKV